MQTEVDDAVKNLIDLQDLMDKTQEKEVNTAFEPKMKELQKSVTKKIKGIDFEMKQNERNITRVKLDVELIKLNTIKANDESRKLVKD